MAGSLLGRVNSDSLRHAVRSLRRDERRTPIDPERLADEVNEALLANPATESLDVSVRAVDDDLLELTGIAPDDDARRIAGAVAAEAAGGAVVVNRILVEGSDVTHQKSGPASGTS